MTMNLLTLKQNGNIRIQNYYNTTSAVVFQQILSQYQTIHVKLWMKTIALVQRVSNSGLEPTKSVIYRLGKVQFKIYWNVLNTNLYA